MLARQSCEWTSCPSDDDETISFDMRQRSQMLVHQLACRGNARLEASRRCRPLRQFVSECFASQSQRGLNLLGW
jgi:hypothetical protein